MNDAAVMHQSTARSAICGWAVLTAMTRGGIIYLEYTATSFNSSQLFFKVQKLLYTQFIEIQQRPKSSKVLAVKSP